ncbi:MAG: ABC transporter ATP-binding protein [Synergistaceae bacterium]|nr:ABC transporter ATP-binding protein [Synergistaceae bacterium]
MLSIRELYIHYITDEGIVKAVNGVSFDVQEGETVGLVGETGAGKTTTALGVMRLVPNPPGRIISGDILLNGESLLGLTEAQMRKIRGEKIAMIFQDPMTSLNPVLTVGDQIAEVVRFHNKKTSRADAFKKAAEMLGTVGIDPDRMDEYPHQFSGGMKQRVGIAIALTCNPGLLIADEPTTALDVTIQAQVLNLMVKLKKEFNTSMLLITHDLGVVADVCDKVAIMYAGEIVEFGAVPDVYRNTGHPYTIGLFGSIPDVKKKVKRLSPIQGLMPDPVDLPAGCSFEPRCQVATAECKTLKPRVGEISPGHMVKCTHHWREANHGHSS